MSLDRLLERLCQTGKFVKLELKAGGILVDKVLEFITKFCFEDVRLWFNVNVERQEEGFRKLADAHADSVLQCPVDFLAPLDIPVPVDARVILGKTKL